MGVYPRAVVSANGRYHCPAPDFGIAFTMLSRAIETGKLDIVGMGFESVFATATAESSDTEVKAVGRMIRGENSLI